MLRGWFGTFGHEVWALRMCGLDGEAHAMLVRCLATKKELEWGYRHLNLFQEIVSGLGLSTQQCDRISSNLVAKDFRAVFKRLKQNLMYAKDQGMKAEEMREVLLKNVNFFTGRPNVFKESWKGLADEFDLSKEEMGGMLAHFPAIIDISMDKKIRPLRNTLANWGIPFSGFRKIVLSYPQVLKQPIQTKLWPLCRIFTDAGFQPKEFGSLVMKFPILLSKPPRDIHPRLKGIQSVGLPRQDMVSIVLKQPKLLKLNIDKRIQWFESILGGNGSHVMRLLLVTSPDLFAGSLDLLSGKVDALEVFGINRPGREAIVRAQPLVLRENIDDLKEKLRIAHDQFGQGPEGIIRFPEYLVLPIEVISERAAYLEHHGICCNDYELDIFIDDIGKFTSRIGSNFDKFNAFCTNRELNINSKQINSLIDATRNYRTLP